jgi:hypothetical protein
MEDTANPYLALARGIKQTARVAKALGIDHADLMADIMAGYDRKFAPDDPARPLIERFTRAAISDAYAEATPVTL